MRTPVVGLLLIFTMNLFAQESEEGKEPAYILRQKQFTEQRANREDLNFARSYFNAYKVLQDKKVSNKRSNDDWTPIGPFGNEPLAGTGRVNSMQIHPTDTNTWFICVAQGGLWKTTNAGASWTSISADLPILRTSSLAIDPSNPDIMYVALGDYAYLGHNLLANESKRNTHYGIGIYKTTDGGQSWKPTGLSFLQTDFEGSLIAKVMIHKTDHSKLIAVAETGSYISNDSAKTWTKTSSKLFWDLEQDPVNTNVLFATTGYVAAYQQGEATIVKSDDFGATWKEMKTNIPRTGYVQRIELAISPTDNNYLYAIACDNDGGFYGFYRSVNGGDTFIQTLDKFYKYNILSGSFYNNPGGQGRYDLAICVDRYDKNHVLIGGINAWHTYNGGDSFIPLTYWALNYYQLSLHADIHEIIQHPYNSSFFACHDGGISRTFTVGIENPDSLQQGVVHTNWVNYTKGLNISSFYRLSINSENVKEKIAGAQDNSTVYTDGTVFRNMSGGDGMESVFQDAEGYRYTSSQYGNINVYERSGNNYFFIGYIQPKGNEVAEWTTPLVNASGQLFVLYGQLYSYYGDNFINQLSNFPLMNNALYPKPGTALAIEKVQAQRIYVAKRGYNSLSIDNELLTTANGGQQWDDIAKDLPRDLYPSYMHMSQMEPEKVWICFSGFDSLNKVFFSADAGKNWSNITYDLPNIPVNCVVHQNDSSDLIYIGTDMGVFYLERGSKNWVHYSKSLPNVIVSELEIDEKSKTLVAATFGRGLWEVGLYKFHQPTKGINSISNERLVSLVYPNPAKAYLDLKVERFGNDIERIRIVDITGREVFSQQCENAGDAFVKHFDLNAFLSGEYFMILEGSNGRTVHRFLKQ